MTIAGYNISGLMLGVAIGAILVLIATSFINAIRHKLTVKTFALQVAKKLSVLACIIGATALSGFLATAAALTLLAAFIDGVISLYRNRSQMDVTDWVLVGIDCLCFLAFGVAVRTAVPIQPNIQPGQASQLPESYYSKTIVDMRGAPGTKSNAAGFPRNGPWFFRQVRGENLGTVT